MRYKRGTIRDMSTEFAFPHCPFREVTHATARRVPGVRAMARLFWPAARRAERVKVDDAGIAAWGLGGETQIAWADVISVEQRRTPLGRESLRVAGQARRIEIASMMPGFADLVAYVERSAAAPLARAA